MVVIILSAIVSYAMYNYGVIFDTSMLVNVLQTNYNEATSYLNFSVFAWLFFLGIVPAIIIYKANIIHAIWYKDILFKITSILISLLTVAIIAMIYYQDYASIKRNNPHLNKMIIPLQFIYSSGEYINKTYFVTARAYQQLGLDAENNNSHANGKNNLLVFVVGETARSMNYQLNGYFKDTNQYTKDLDLISFKHVSSCGTNTAVSVPCMFSNLTHENYSAIAANSQDNLLDVLQHAGLNVLWVDNNSGCNQVCKNVTTINISTENDYQWCDGNSCVDEVLLANLQTQINSLAEKDSVIVLHVMGSHGPTYYKRCPQEHQHFKPGCFRSDIQNCTAEELLNTYDNSILYTDFVLNEIINLLRKNNKHWDTSVIYVSDHGESLGEKHLYLHGLPYNLAPKEQTHVPYITWFSKSFIRTKKINMDCLRNKAAIDHYSHDNIFSSILGLMDISTKEYNQTQDIFYSCRYNNRKQ